MPTGATRARLCSYDFADAAGYLLATSHDLTTGVDPLVDYLNALPDAPAPDELCLAIGTTQHVIVLSYGTTSDAVVYGRGCGLDHDGQVRYGAGLADLMGFWGLGLND